jgi:hypothetical protein
VKPDTRTAMGTLIGQIRAAIPFDLPEGSVCLDSCDGCSMKLLEFLESELEGWERRLEQGEQPNFGDLSRLAGTARKIHRVLERNGLVEGGPLRRSK